MPLNLLSTADASGSSMSFGMTFVGDGTSTVWKGDISKWPFRNPGENHDPSFNAVFTAQAELGSVPTGYTSTLAVSVAGTILTVTFGTAPPAQTGFLDKQVGITVFLLYAGL